MCLSRVDEKFDPPSKEIGIGWKWFKIKNGAIRSVHDYGIADYHPGKWIHDQSDGDLSYSTFNYKFGFYETNYYSTGYHLYKSERSAKRHGCSVHNKILLQVKYTNVVAKGKDKQPCAIVARSIMILPGQLERKRICKYEYVPKKSVRKTTT